ncbi:hypothetical protein IC607_02785 [Cellulomonas sp. JH27-2]|uniref:hypothetical protein n=1 Tax=Cellulomonas sp. JH27-2 TaxID=2774139 RepID=UPI001781A8EB|nr:hypothetical protein [Cellulomonas sp. JH27-2]MBD8057889.1 hypothetical protein [Cellulomonas sp. JH27-2]
MVDTTEVQMRRAGVVALSGMCALALASCSAASKADVGPSVLPTKATSAAATPTQGATPAATPTTATSSGAPAQRGAQDLSDPKLGIVFADVPGLTGAAADAYNSLARYETEYWRTLTTNKVSPGVSELYGTDAATSLKKIAAANAKNKADIGGTVHVTISDVAIAKNGRSATATVCDNFDQATFKDPSGTYTPKEAGFGPRRQKVTVTPGPANGFWRIYKIETEGSC